MNSRREIHFQNLFLLPTMRSTVVQLPQPEHPLLTIHHRTEQEFKQTPGDGEGQGSLACCSPWGRKELDTAERQNDSKNRTKHSRRSFTSSKKPGVLFHPETTLRFREMNPKLRVRRTTFQTLLLPKRQHEPTPRLQAPGAAHFGEPRDPQLDRQEPGKPDRNQALGKEVFERPWKLTPLRSFSSSSAPEP